MAGSPGVGSEGGVVRRALLAATALAGACLVALSGGDAAAAEPRLARSAGGVSDSIPWGECDPPGEGLQCARIRVPLDWDRPNGRTINLAVARHLASKPNQRIGSLLTNPGGPGDTGVGLVTGDPEGMDAIGDGRFDVVSWDTRGTHASSPRLRCFESKRGEARFWAGESVPTTPAAAKRTVRHARAFARRCNKISGWLLPHISTADTARDMDYIRQLVGEEKLTYVGLSYGTYLGQTYANMFPDRVRAMLLDGIVNPLRYSKSVEARETMFSDAADDVMDQFLALCERQGPERCALAGGQESPAEKWEGLLARLKRGPIRAPGGNGTNLSPQKLTYGDLLFSQFEPMRAPRTWPLNAANLDAAVRGNGSALESAAGQFTSPAGWGGARTSAAIQCADAGADRPPRAGVQVWKRLKRAGTLQGPVHFAWEWAPCAVWPVQGEDNYRGPWNNPTPNPILLVNQTHDPNSGYGNALAAEQALGNAVLLTQEGYGHLWFQNPSTCVDEAYADYLINLVTPPPGSVCQSNQKPFDPNFVSP
jgi:pimeloyl-ACP methyl ester carboxylesterase